MPFIIYPLILLSQWIYERYYKNRFKNKTSYDDKRKDQIQRLINKKY